MLAGRGAVLWILLFVCGCTGGSDETASAPSFAATDARRIGSVRPVTPGWPAWPRNATVTHDDPDGVEFGHKWSDQDKIANLVVQRFRDAAAAEEWLPEFNEFSRQAGDQTGSIAKDEAVDDLGDEAWVLVVGGNGTQVTYHWRRGNLAFEAHLHCFGDCPLDVEPAARAWADAIDEEARAQD